MPVEVLHVSVVHGLLSAQSASLVQQPLIGECWQTWVVVLQVSVVQELLSSH